jgi:cephalosporin hydroxylase
MWESNCLFVARKQLEQVGGFDEGFTTPGGGYTNLDLFERLASAPDISVVTILGEGSFHQVHGGTTTNQTDPVGRRARVVESTTEYEAVRGRPFKGPTKVMHFVGAFPAEAAKRSRARRMTAWAFPVDNRLEGASEPVAVPDEIRDGFVDAYWRSGAVERTSWLGQKLANAPTDLFVYQEIIDELRPDWIIETGTGEGGRAAFLASICDLLDHGRVVSVGSGKFRNPPPHPRISYVVGRSSDPQTLAQVRDIVGDGSALVILGTRAGRHTTRAEFDAYKDFVAVGSYVIIEHTVLNGFPVDATHGPGPHEAVRWILNHAPDFVADTEREKFALTFNSGGFLRRIR